MQGWIKLHRDILQWEWYDDHNTKILFLHLLLKASHTSKKWRGITIQPGENRTSTNKLSKELGLSIQQIRTSLDHLKSTSEITIKTTNKNTVISINNWNCHQQDNKQNNKQTTNKQQTNNTLTSGLKNVKNVKNEKNVENEKNLVYQNPPSGIPLVDPGKDRLGEEEARSFLKSFNEIRGTRFNDTGSFLTNFIHWRKTYSLEEMVKAVVLAKHDAFFNKAITPVKLLRTKNKNGECDNVGELLNMKIVVSKELSSINQVKGI